MTVLEKILAGGNVRDIIMNESQTVYFDKEDYAEKNDPEYGRCGTCAHYGQSVYCDDCEDGSEYEFDDKNYELPAGVKVLDEAKEPLTRDQIAQLDVDAIIPDQKDKDRAANLTWRGHTFKGNGDPWASEASKMAKLITDPYKLVRRSKAVAAKWNDRSSTSHDMDADVWTPFRDRLSSMGFTADQIRKIADYRD